MFYRLNGRTPVQCDCLEEDCNGVVAKNTIGNITISTVFLAIDHQFGDGPPILFETMIFGMVDDEYQRRYSTWEEAEAGHQIAVEIVTELMSDKPIIEPIIHLGFAESHRNLDI